MTGLQFRVLYREFLFRMVDLELLSVKGDLSRLLGQFATLLILLSTFLSLGALGLDIHMPSQTRLIATWASVHSLIALTMLVVGLFAVLSWDSAFPNRRDVLVLAPLPVRSRTLFMAKVSASAAALGVTVAALNVFTGLAWPLALALSNPRAGSFLNLIFSLDLYRTFVAYWATMFSAGGFIFCAVLCVQGLAAQLPRRHFLRLSAFLQMAAFGLFVTVFFLQPSFATPVAFAAPENQRSLAWLPSYWFLGIFQQLHGAMHPALAPLARRAWIALAVAVPGAAAAFLLSYFRTLRKIIEEPDILPGARGLNLLPRFGNSFQTAVAQFSIRTLFRSRQHRVILAFYLGIGFAIVILLTKTPAVQEQYLTVASGVLNAPMLASSIVMLCVAIFGVRVLFSMPLDLRANWIFRIAPVRAGPRCLKVNRRLLFSLAVAPVWIVSAALFLCIWPWRPVVAHLVVLALLGMIFVELCLHGFQKIPFTCSYLPGKSYAHMAILGFAALMFVMNKGAELERQALQHPTSYAALVIVLALIAVCVRWRTAALAESSEAVLQFEDEPTPAVLCLGLCRDGVFVVEPRPIPPPAV